MDSTTEILICRLAQAQKEKQDRGEGLPAALEAFASVTGGDLEDIPELCAVIEQLLDSLRDLRRNASAEFFGQPVERLYDSLEASLSDFYRSGVSGQRDPDKRDPRGS